MSNIAIDILILLFGCASFMGILIFALTYREIKIKKLASEQDTKEFVAMRLYKEHSNAERERKANKPDKTLADTQNVFGELRKTDLKTDPNEPKFGQGWFPYTVRRDFEEMKRQREQHHDKTS